MPRLVLPRPHPAQRQILHQACRFNCICLGRRSGKSTLGRHLLIETALQGHPAAYFAPTYKMLAEVWRDLRKALAPVTKAISEQEKRIELITGGTIDCWSLEVPDACRGRKYRRVVIDESAMIDCLEIAWTDSIRPTLADYAPDSDAWMLSTPRGRNFFWRCYLLGQSPEHPEWMSWQMPSSANPYLNPSEIEAMRLELPERSYRQEILAEFLEDEGQIFRNVKECIVPGSKPIGPEPGRRYYMGVDVGMVDYTAISVIDDQGKQVYAHRLHECGWDMVYGAIIDAAKLYRASVVIESNNQGGQAIYEVQKAGIRVEAFNTNTSKGPLIDALAVALERGQLQLLDLPHQTEELLAYEYKTKGSKVTMQCPWPLNDDCVIGLALSWHALKNRPTPIELL